jgi:hypothetical protein
MEGYPVRALMTVSDLPFLVRSRTRNYLDNAVVVVAVAAVDIGCRAP